MLCPNCDKEIVPELHKERRFYWFRDDMIQIMDQFNRCPKCLMEWSVEGFDFALEVYTAHAIQHPGAY